MSGRTPPIKGGWKGRYVITKVDMVTNGGEMFPEGSLMQVANVHGGLELRTAIRCPTCMRDRPTDIAKVSTFKVTALPVDFQPSPEMDVIGRLTQRIHELEAERDELLNNVPDRLLLPGGGGR